MAKLTLAEMLAAQKAKKEETNHETPGSSAVSEPAKPDSVPPSNPPAQPTKPAGSALASKFGGIKFGGGSANQPRNVGSNPGVDGKPKPAFTLGKKPVNDSAVQPKPAAGNPDDNKRPSGASGALAALAATTDPGVAPEVEGKLSQYVGFSDEEPASKPDRELPADITDTEKQFVTLLDSIYDVLHDPELVGSVLRNFMIELQENPEYRRLVAPEDVRNLIVGARHSMGMAKVKKQEAKAKRAGGKRASGAKADQLAADLESLGIDFGAFGDE